MTSLIIVWPPTKAMSELVNDPLVQLQAFLIAALVIAALAGWWTFRRQQRKRRQRDQEFVNLLLAAFENRTVSDLAELAAFHEAHFGHRERPVGVYRDIHSFLQRIDLQVSSAHVSKPEHSLIPRLTELRELRASVASALAQEEKRVPFYGTPEPERGLLEDILELTTSDKTIVSDKLTRLAEMVVARSETIKTLGEEKGQARRLAYWGLAGTVVFGVLSIVLTLWSRGNGAQ